VPLTLPSKAADDVVLAFEKHRERCLQSPDTKQPETVGNALLALRVLRFPSSLKFFHLPTAPVFSFLVKPSPSQGLPPGFCAQFQNGRESFAVFDESPRPGIPVASAFFPVFFVWSPGTGRRPRMCGLCAIVLPLNPPPLRASNSRRPFGPLCRFHFAPLFFSDPPEERGPSLG